MIHETIAKVIDGKVEAVNAVPDKKLFERYSELMRTTGRDRKKVESILKSEGYSESDIDGVVRYRERMIGL